LTMVRNAPSISGFGAFYGYGYPEKLRCGLSGQRLLSNIEPF
jgi:hypothetical protein